MASKSTSHARSCSLPCENHPLVASVEEKLSNFKSTDSVWQKLGGLKDLYERFDDLLQLPLTRQATSSQNREKLVNEMLDGSVQLLDLCCTSKDVFSQMKGIIQELESSLRRKKNAGSNVEDEVRTYMSSGKKLNKVISKSLANVRTVEKNSKAFKDLGFVDSARTMKEVEKTSLMVFESVLSSVYQTKTRTCSKWQGVSKMFKSKHELQADANEMEKMDAELNLLLVSKQTKAEEIENLPKRLEAMEYTFQNIEEELECVYRQLLKIRVSLLNKLNL